jgi:hypothetical protein
MLADKVVKLCNNCGLSCNHECIRKRRKGYRRCFYNGIRREVRNDYTCNGWQPIVNDLDKQFNEK